MILHDFTTKTWGNNLEKSGACWSFKGAVQSGDFFKLEDVYYKALEAKPCGDPKDMSFIKKYITLGSIEEGETITADELEIEYQNYKNEKTIYSFPIE